jgi:hypothetical protein
MSQILDKEIQHDYNHQVRHEEERKGLTVASEQALHLHQQQLMN